MKNGVTIWSVAVGARYAAMFGACVASARACGVTAEFHVFGEHQRVLADLIGRQEERQAELVRVVAANTEALRAVSQEIRWCKERSLAAGAARE